MHTAKNCKSLLYNTLDVLYNKYPTKSGIKPIKHLWSEIEKRLKNYDITLKDVLKQNIKEI